MSNKIGNVCHTNPVNDWIDDGGKPRKKWDRYGAAFQSPEGKVSFVLNGFPVGIPQGGVWFSVFPDDPKGGQQTNQGAPTPPQSAVTEGFDDDIPFS